MLTYILSLTLAVYKYSRSGGTPRATSLIKEH